MTHHARSRLAGLIVLASLAATLWLDVSMLLGNPVELQMRTRQLLERTLGELQPEFTGLQVELPQRVRLEGFTLKDPESGELLLKARAVEVALGLTGLSRVELIGVQVQADFDGDFDFEGTRPDDDSPPLFDLSKLPIDVEDIPADITVAVRDARILLYDSYMQRSWIVQVPRFDSDISTGLALRARGDVEVFLLIPETHQEYGAARELVGLPAGKRALPIVERIAIEAERRRRGELVVHAEGHRVHAREALGEAFHPWLYDNVWLELGPEGHCHGAMDLRVDAAGEASYAVTLSPQGMASTLKGFPYRVSDIWGDFHIVHGVVTWENVRGRARGQGRVEARGSVFLGSAEESVSLYAMNRFYDIPIDAEVDRAIAVADEGASEAVRMFSPSGEVTGYLTVSRDAQGGPPVVSADIRDLGGTVNARYTEVPIATNSFRGKFRLMEGGGVELEDVRFDIEGGGEAQATGMLLRNDLIFLDIRARDVPVRSELLARMPPKVQDYVRPLAPSGGRCDARVLIRKASPDAKTAPEVDIHFKGVEITPELMPHPVALTGTTRIRLSYPDGTREDEAVEPTISVDVDARGESARGGAISGGRVRGQIVIRELGEAGAGVAVSPDLAIEVAGLRLDEELLSQAPAEAREAIRPFSPKGRLEDVRVLLRALDRFEVTARGAELEASYEAFPVAARPERLALALDGRRLTITGVEGRVAGGGRFRLQGGVMLPPPGPGDGGLSFDAPIVDLRLEGQSVVLREEVIAAFPEALEEVLRALAPAGEVSATLTVSSAPGLTDSGDPLITGRLGLEGVSANVFALLPEEERFSRERILDLRGEVELGADELRVVGVEGRLLGARVKATGRVARPDAQSPQAGAAQAFVASLEGLQVGPKLRSDVPAEVQQLLDDYDPRGPVDLELRLNRAESGEVELATRVIAKGLTAAPKILGSRFAKLEGSVEVEGGEPTIVDLRGTMEGAPVEIRRSAFDEGNGPEDGMRLLVKVHDFGFAKEAVGRLPEALRGLIEALEPEGGLDATACLQLWPEAAEQAPLYLTELVARDLDVSAGLRVEGIAGAIELSGRIEESPRVRGGLALERLSILSQPLEKLRARLDIEDGKVLLQGIRGRLHDGAVSGFARLDTESLATSVTLDFDDLSFARVVEGLRGLAGSAPPKDEDLPDRPLTGRVAARFNFSGTPDRPQGRGEVTIKNSNAVPVPIIFRLTEALGARGANVSSFDRIRLKLRFEGSRGQLKTMVLEPGSRLQSRNLDLAVVGRITLVGPEAGQVDLRFVPEDPTDRLVPVRWLTRMLKDQLTTLRATGTLDDPTIIWIPLGGIIDVIDDLQRGVFEGGEEDGGAGGGEAKPTPKEGAPAGEAEREER